MSDKSDGGSAFPQTSSDCASGEDGGHLIDVSSAGGMSLRDYFAGKALPAVIEAWEADRIRSNEPSWDADLIAEESYEIADAMIAHRSQKAP